MEGLLIMYRAAEYSAVEHLRNGRSIQIRALRAIDRTILFQADQRSVALPSLLWPKTVFSRKGNRLLLERGFR